MSGTFHDQFLGNILTEEDNEVRKEEFGLFRSGSAPPAIFDDEQNDEPTTDIRYDPNYHSFYYSQRLLNPRLPPPIVNWRSSQQAKKKEEEKKEDKLWVDLSTNKKVAPSNSPILTGDGPSLVDRIQEDFPSTPSSLYKKKNSLKKTKNVKSKKKISLEPVVVKTEKPEDDEAWKKTLNGAKKDQKLLEEFKSGKGRKFELKDILGNVIEFSKDQHGSRFIQQKLETATSQEKESIFQEIFSDSLSLMTDVFGNYVIQKIFEYGLPSQKKALTKMIKGNVLNLTLQTYGCRVIQKALEVIDDDDKVIIAEELNGSIMKCVQDQNGNHVIQKCIEKIPPKNIQFIVDSFVTHVITLATHAYGCRVIQRILEYCNEIQCKSILDEILNGVTKLVKDQYGNYVVQHVLEHSKPKYKLLIVRQFKGLVVTLSSHKFASNVIERCFKNGGKKEKQDIVDEITGRTIERTSPIFDMMNDQYANYVVQKIIELSDDNQKNSIIDTIKANLNHVKKLTYGKHIILCCEKYTLKPLDKL